jgi:hypothetical protein
MEKNLQYPLDRRLYGPQSLREKVKILNLPGLELLPFRLPARSQSRVRLRYCGSAAEQSTNILISFVLKQQLRIFGNILYKHNGEVILFLYMTTGARGSVVVEALCYKPEGRGFDTR